MKVFLLHREEDLQVKPELRDALFDAMHSSNVLALGNLKRNIQREHATNSRLFGRRPTSDDMLIQDLELTTLWNAMACGDEFLFEVAKRATLSSLTDPDAICYRQQVLADCLRCPGVIHELYALALEALESERTAGSLSGAARPTWVLRRSVKVLALHLQVLRQLRQIADDQADEFRSEGFTRFFAMLRKELADAYLENIERRLRELSFSDGLLESARLGKGHKASCYTVHERPAQSPPGWRERLGRRNKNPTDVYSFELHPRDATGFRALEDIRGQGLNDVANAVAQSADHIKSFFVMLRLELAFYRGCLNLRARLEAKGEPICLPEPLPIDAISLNADALYDVSLALHLEGRAVGNELRADGKTLIVITGANQGGKSTLLRSIGLAQLMMQAGMFVGAQAFRANVCTGVFSHYNREEDSAMESGKLEEELNRMSEISDRISPRAILLCNESFASTNEREGSGLARQVIRAYLANQIKVFFVTHMYDLAHSWHTQPTRSALFLRAERRPDGTRTFKLAEGEPLPTSYGEDSYRRIFRCG